MSAAMQAKRQRAKLATAGVHPSSLPSRGLVPTVKGGGVGPEGPFAVRASSRSEDGRICEVGAKAS